MYNFYISTEIKRLDGDADEIEELDGGGDDNLLVNQTEIGGGGFADDTATKTGADGTGTSPEVQMDELGEQALVSNDDGPQQENIESCKHRLGQTKYLFKHCLDQKIDYFNHPAKATPNLNATLASHFPCLDSNISQPMQCTFGE